MRFVRRRPRRETEGGDDDPLAGIANLFDVSVAFIVALLIALVSMTSMQSLLDPTSSFTMVKQNADGSMEIVTKDKSTIKVQKTTDRSMSGAGVRLGMAYRLGNGQVVYVPDTAVVK